MFKDISMEGKFDFTTFAFINTHWHHLCSLINCRNVVAGLHFLAVSFAFIAFDYSSFAYYQKKRMLLTRRLRLTIIVEFCGRL